MGLFLHKSEKKTFYENNTFPWFSCEYQTFLIPFFVVKCFLLLNVILVALKSDGEWVFVKLSQLLSAK